MSQKLYYSISEVAQMFNIKEHTLRFWEKEFDILKPKRGAKDIRYYRQEDIDVVKLIYHLREERGMTVAGVKKKLKENKETVIQQEEIVSRLKMIKEEILALKSAFDSLGKET